MHSPVQRVAFHLSDTMRSETSPPPCSQKYAEVCVEPDLQPVTSDQLNGASANSQDSARLVVSANGVWGGRFQKTYFYVRVFNPLAPSKRNQAPAAVYRKHELEKKQAYQQRIQEVEHSSFTPRVLSATGGMGNEASYHLLQATGITALQHNPILATVPPELLPPLLIYPSNQRCQILSGTCSEVTNCHRPCYHQITHQREQLVTTSSKLLSYVS